MPWLKIDDGEGMSPWVLQVGNEAYGVFVRLNSYAAQHLTDGVVPAPIAAMIAGDVDPATGASRLLATLVMAGRIDRDEHGGTIRLPYFLDSNPSAAQVEADREARQTRATKAAAARWNGKR